MWSEHLGPGRLRHIAAVTARTWCLEAPSAALDQALLGNSAQFL